ncbi:MAG TPA: prepilin-type N-terminal cleavage/methylation domain-containing protein [Burkholderiaceae bacterium]
MSRKCSEQRGFTLPELVMVLIILGVLSVVALPRLAGMLTIGTDAWRGDIVATLRLGHSTALARRRLICASVSTGSVSLNQASANPATSCDASLSLTVANGADALTRGNAPATTSMTIYFQPDGRATNDAAGTSSADLTLNISGYPDILVANESGYVR